MGRTLTYPKLPRNSVNRLKDRGNYDVGTIHSIVNETLVAHVSFSPDPADPFPAILPMIAVMGSFEFPSASIDEPLDCYLHGYVSSRIMNLARTSSSTSTSESESEAKQGIPVCVAATKVDGLVLSLTPNSHSYNYRSAVLHGYGTLVESVEEKLFAMELITNSVVPDRWANSRTPPDGAEMQSTVILRVRVVDASAKIRDGAPHDEVKDTGREDLGKRIWTGVVPVHEVFGTPVPSADNRVDEVPGHIKDYVEEANGKNERYARDAAVDPS